jgi:murein DD-endopeptidase MepM/ murein hydrolase activator NlpD
MWRPPAPQTALVAASFTFASAACGGPEPAPRPSFVEAENHAHYVSALGEFGLDKAALGRDWLIAAERALVDPEPVTLPFHESGYLPPSSPGALGYRFDLRRGRTLRLDVEFDGEPARLFIDLFELEAGREPRQVAATTGSERHLEYEARRDGLHLLRIQPELLRGGRVTVVERTLASLGFPVDGLSLQAVQSVFGDPRDGGRRDHHGLDIFAPRGTPVLAAVDGTVRVGTGERGGQLIWLYDANAPDVVSDDGGDRDRRRRRRGRRLYYAHLDDWAVANGDAVRAGDVIGYVGNTGNARTTPPHLHFGVYDRGPVDPAPFLRPDDPLPVAPSGTLDVLDGWVRVTRPNAPLRDAGHALAGVRDTLPGDHVLRVLAAAGAYYRVTSPDGRRGYVSIGDVTPALEPIDSAALAAATPVRDRPHAVASVIEILAPTVSVDVLGHVGEFRFVRLPDARVGWLPSPTPIDPPGL